MTADFWRGRSVFLTGHTGFKGSWLSLWLTEAGARVSGYALEPPTTPNLFALARVRARLQNHSIDNILDQDRLQAALGQCRPEIVIHMAAQPILRHSFTDPVGTYATNVMGTAHLLNAIRSVDSIRVVLIVTSDKCYENHGWTWGYREIDGLGGHDPYSSSKACAELVVSAFRQSFFPPETFDRHRVVIASARAGNVIGGGDWAKDRLVPDLMRALLAGEDPIVRSPTAVRPWQHVLEPLGGYLALCEHGWCGGPSFGESWNFGPDADDARPVGWIADRIVELWGRTANWRLTPDSGPPEATYLYLDSAKAKARLSVRPRWNIDRALLKIVEWYRGFRDGGDLEALSLTQISAFLSEGVRTAL